MMVLKVTARSINSRSLSPLVATVLIAATVVTCDAPAAGPTAGDRLAVGTWGDSAVGVVVSDSGTHVHIGCTFGDIAGVISLDASGRFDVSGSYVLRAYPIVLGPSHPARFTGRVVGTRLTLTVTIDDTVEHRTEVRGPVTARFGRVPKLGPCPICQLPPWVRTPRMAAAR